MTDVQVPRQSSSGESSSGPTPSPLVAKVNPLSVETQRFTGSHLTYLNLYKKNL